MNSPQKRVLSAWGNVRPQPPTASEKRAEMGCAPYLINLFTDKDSYKFNDYIIFLLQEHINNNIYALPFPDHSCHNIQKPEMRPFRQSRAAAQSLP